MKKSIIVLCFLVSFVSGFCNDKESQKLVNDISIYKVSILGDSYSTFKNYLTPTPNSPWYPRSSNDNDVQTVEQTWWYQFIQENGSVLEYNNSYSGSTICNTGYSGGNSSSSSFITRMKDLGNPNLIIIFGGTNDSWANSPLGNYKYSDWTENDLKSFRPAFAYMLDYLIKKYPNEKIINLVNSELKSEIADAQKLICKQYNVENIQLNNINKMAGHPSIAGMISIKNQILNIISNIEDVSLLRKNVNVSRIDANKVKVSINSELSGNLELALYNMQGQLLQTMYTGANSKNSYELVAPKNNSYILRIVDANGSIINIKF
jgi:hypothetical protein